MVVYPRHGVRKGKSANAKGEDMEHTVEKLLYSRRDAAEALSLSVRSVDYLITTRRLPTRRIGAKILIPAAAVRRFAREDHPDLVRSPKGDLSSLPKKPPVSIGASRQEEDSAEVTDVLDEPRAVAR